MDRLTELRGRRAELATRAAGLRAKSERTAEETEQYDLTLNQIQEIDTEIEREERFLQSESRDADFMRRHPAANTDPAPAPAPGGEQRRVVNGVELRELRMRGEGMERDASGLRAYRDVTVYRDPAVRQWFRELRSEEVGNSSRRLEARAFQVGSETEGGYLSAGEEFVARLIQAVDDQVFIRQLATVQSVMPGFTSMGFPSLDTDAEDADWTVELGTGNEEDSLRFGRRVLEPHPLAKRVKISRELLRAAAMDAESIVLSRIAYKFGVTQEKAFLTGDGDKKPLGLFTASNDGISTARDVSTGNTTTEIRTDGIIEAQYTLKSQYWPRARWLFHRDAIKQIAKLKDGEGRYLWEPSIRASDPDTLRGRPIVVSEFAPNTFTTGQYVGLFGDFSFYWIADSLAMTMQRLVELYAETNQIGFIGRLQTDGMPVLEEAFVRVKLA